MKLKDLIHKLQQLAANGNDDILESEVCVEVITINEYSDDEIVDREYASVDDIVPIIMEQGPVLMLTYED